MTRGPSFDRGLASSQYAAGCFPGGDRPEKQHDRKEREEGEETAPIMLPPGPTTETIKKPSTATAPRRSATDSSLRATATTFLRVMLFISG